MKITEITMGDVEEIFQSNCSRIVRQIRAAATTGDDGSERQRKQLQPASQQPAKPATKAKGAKKKRTRKSKKSAGPKRVPLKRAPMPKQDPPDKAAPNKDGMAQQPKQAERPKLHFGRKRPPHPATQLGPYAPEKAQSTPSADDIKDNEPK